MKKSQLLLAIVLAIFLILGTVLALLADTTQHPPLRGSGIVLVPTNTIPKSPNFPVERALTGKALIMAISMKAPPALPTNNLARLRWIDGDIYEMHWDEGDTILLPNKPILKQSKSGKWMLIYPSQVP